LLNDSLLGAVFRHSLSRIESPPKDARCHNKNRRQAITTRLADEAVSISRMMASPA